MSTETGTLCCSYCRGGIARDKFVIANEASVLRLHPSCVSKLSRDLDQWVYRGQQKSFALGREFPIAVFFLSLAWLPPSGVLELAGGLDEWICQYEQDKSLALAEKYAPKVKGAK